MTSSTRAVYARHVNNPNPEIAAICREEMKMDDKQRQTLDKARELLPKVTPGKWAVVFRKDRSAYVNMGDSKIGPHKAFNIGLHEDEHNDKDDAALIALSPDLAALADTLARRVEVLEGENERLKDALYPFAFFDDYDSEDSTQKAWTTIYKDRVQDWVDFNDIEAARAALSATQPKEPRT